MITRLLFVAVALALAFVPVPRAFVERWYTDAFYARVQPFVTGTTNLVPVACLDLAAGVALLAFIVLLTRRVRRAGWLRGAARTAVTAVWFGAWVYVVFAVMWGLNYRRPLLEEKLEFDRGRVTRDAAFALANDSAVRVNGLYATAHATVRNDRALAFAFDEATRLLGDGTRTRVGRPKRSLLQLYFRYAGIDGMTDPWFLEVTVNPDVLEVERPFVLAHEWAHLAGYANESEANFLAWLTCARGDELAQYSGWFTAWAQAVRALPRERRAAVRPLDTGPRADRDAMIARYQRASPAVQAAARDVYDRYLKANRVREGIESYDRVLQLILGTSFDAGWRPRLRAGVPFALYDGDVASR